MSIPDYQSLMLPMLKLLADGRERSLADVIAQLEDQFRLTEEERKQLLPSGQKLTFHDRASWARTYLKHAGLVEVPHRGWIRITARGRDVLRENPERIDIKFLERYEEFRSFRLRRRENGTGGKEQPVEKGTPKELMDQAYEMWRRSLAADLLDQVKKVPPVLFEQIVVRLLANMGYGGSDKEAARAVGGSGDGGIDGVINEDPLGLDVIYVQAKRWDGPVGRPEVQKFAGALEGHRARKGVFVTTSTFTPDAVDYAQRLSSKIVLIDGQRLVDLMIEYDLGVSPDTTYQLKKIDSDYFAAD